MAAAVARATSPAPPLAVETGFKRTDAGKGLLTVRGTARQSLSAVTLAVSLPTVLDMRLVEPRGRNVDSREIDKDHVEYSVPLVDRLEGGTVTAILELSARGPADLQTSEIDVRAIGRTEDGGTAVGQVSLFVAVTDGKLNVQSDGPGGHPCLLVAIPQIAVALGLLLLLFCWHKFKT